TWAAYAGDVRGTRPADGVESYVRRRFRHPAARLALETLAVEQVLREEFGLANAAAVELLRPLLPALREAWKADAQDLLIDLVDRGLLVKHQGERYSLHPALAGVLTASALLAGHKPELLARDYSPGAAWQEALPHFAAQADPGPLVNRWLNGPAEVFPDCLLCAAGWLRDAPQNARWRSEVLRRLAQALLNPDSAGGLRGRAVAAFFAAREANAAQLFRQALGAPDHRSRLFAALGLGALRDSSAVTLLARRLSEDLHEVRRAACLALAAIGTGPAVETLAQTLLTAGEEARRAAAEALAFHRAEGHTLLQEALAEPDLLVRRAAIYGLRWVDEAWVGPALREAQMHDSEWIIRSSAEEVLQKRANLVPPAPAPPVPPHELSWLLAFAAARGTGVPPGPPAIAMLVRASREGTAEERAAAVQALGAPGVEGMVEALYRALADPDPEVRDLAFDAVAETAAALGQRLPPPKSQGSAPG
ncbi:MAG: HEAT repeat domain-containing protein, partial [Chloroflexi bacterium]|nr:HEAT repeat domain-containing protein [Chloroflexota bacterium]